MKTKHQVRPNAFLTSKKRVSCLGRRNELITITLPNSGVARTVCYVVCFVQPTANTKTCLPINNYGEYRKFLFDLFSATANRRKCLKNGKFTANTKRRHFFFDSANSKIGLNFYRLRRIAKNIYFFFPPTVN